MNGNEIDWIPTLLSCTDRFAATIESADLTVPVGSCPGWSVADLAVHLGEVHLWAAGSVGFDGSDLSAAPRGETSSSLANWYRECACHLGQALAETPPTSPAWTLDDADQTAGFWRRRQVHETALHLWDAQTAIGRPEPMDRRLAWDGVLEVRDVIYPRQVRLGRVAPLTPAARLVASDVEDEATIGIGEPAIVSATSEVLLRLLWHRADAITDAVGADALEVLAPAVTP